MVIIKNQSIQLTRGDYASLVFIAEEYNPGTEQYVMYELQEGDKVRFQLGKKYGTPLITKEKVKRSGETTADDYTIEIEAEDTKDLKFGDYVYDVSLIVNQDECCTYIGADEENQPKFTILQEVGASDE